MSLDKTLLGVAKSAVDTQRKSRDGRNVVSKGVDAVTNKSYANEDKKVAAAALRKWENEVWKPKTEARLKQEMSERVSHLKPGSDAYNQTYQSLYNKNHQGLQAAKAKAYQQLGTLRQKGQTQRQVDNRYTQKESLRNNTAKIQSAASVGRDVAEEAAGALATGTSRALRYPLQLAADVGENDDGSIFDRGAKALERHEDNLQQVYPAYADTQQNGSFTENLTLSAIEQIPNLALSFTGAGAAAKGAQLAGAGAKMTAATAYGTAAATMYPQAYGDGNDSTKQELENATPEQLATAVRSKDIYKGHFDKNIKAGMSEDEAYQKARDQTISSIAEESGDAVGLATLALSMLAPGVGSFTANRAAGGAVSKWGQKVFNTLAVKADAGKVAKVAIPAAVGTGIVGLNFAEEALQEGFTDKVAQQAAVDVGVKDKIDTAQTKEAMLMGGILGAAMGGGVYVGTRNSKLHQAQDDLKTAQQAYAEVAGQIPQLQQQIEEVSPRSPEGQALTARVEETRAALDAMAAEAEKAGIPRTSLARRAPRIDPTNSAASDFDGQVEGATELSEQDFENALNPDGTPAAQAPVVQPMSEAELDAQDAQLAELIAEQAALDEAIEDGSSEKPLEESIAAAQSWYDSKRGEGKQGLAGVVSRAAATEQDAAFAQQQESIKGATASINDYIASERAKQQQLDAEIEQDALAAKTEREKKEVEQRARQREIDRAQEDELLAKRTELAQPYENEAFDTTVIGADGAPFNLARFWDSNMPATAKAKAIADAFGGQVEQNVAKADWQSMPEGVQKELHQWFAERLDGVRQSREGGEQTAEQVAAPAVEPPQEVAPTANSLTMPVQQPVVEQAPIAPVEEQTPIAPVEVEQVAEIDSTPAATQLTDENPVINIPAPITDEPALIELQAPVADEVNTEQPPITVERYKSKPAARAAIKKQKLDPDSVTIKQVKGGGFEIVPNAPAKPSYAQAQEQAANELGLSLDENGEYGGTDAEFETFAKRVDEIQGRSLSNSKPTPKQNAAVPTDDVAIGKDGLAKWFGKADKAQAFIDKKGISDTHEVVSAGKSRFEIQPKAQTTGATNQTSTPTDVISENGSSVAQDLTATGKAPLQQDTAAPKKAPRELSDKAMVREMQKPTTNNGEVDYKSKLNLSEGQNLGRLIMSSGRVFDDAVVKSMDDKSVTLEATVNGKRGLHKGLQYQTVDAGINNTKSYAKQQAARQEVNNNDNSSSNASEANETADNAGASRAEERVSDRNAPKNAVARQTQARAGLDAPPVDQEVSPPKTYAQVQTEVANEMGITTNEDGKYDITDAQFDTMEGRVRERMEAQENQAQPQAPVTKPETVAANPIKPPQSSVEKAETEPETEKPAAKPEPNPVEKPTPTGDWRSQVGGNEIRDNKDGITVRKHDRVVHIRGANSIAANKKARELASQEIRELHYIAAKENPSDPFSEASIWLDSEGDMIRKKGTKKPKGALLQVLKQSESSPKSQPTVKPDNSNDNAGMSSSTEAKFSKTNPAKGNTGTTAKQVVSTLQKRFGKEAVAALIKSGKLRVRTLNDFVNADGQLLIPSDAEGFYYDGKVTLIADNLTDDTVVATLLHEMGGHAGIQSMLETQTYMSLMENFYALVRSGNKYAVRAKERAEASAYSDSEARDEYIPYLITEYAQATERGGPLAVIKRFVNRVVAGVRAWVRNHTGVQLKMTPNDMVQLAERMVKRLAEQSTSDMAIAGIENMPAAQMQFSQESVQQANTPAFREWFDANNPDIHFSRRYSELGQDTRPTDKKGKAVSVAKQGLSASLSSWYITKLLMRRHLATPLHVSLLDSYFKIFHDNVQSRIAYENYEAGRIQEYLPEIWDTRLRVGKKKEAIEKVARAYFDGTMADKVWTPEELAEKFNLDDSQQDMYYRTRQATDESLKNLTIDTISVLGKGTKLVNIHTVNKLKLEGLNPKDHKAKLQAGMVNELEKLGKGGLITPKAEARMQKQLDDVFKVMDAITDKSDKLIEQGYAPLMRFGHYAVEVRNKESNELDLFELYETKGEQDRAIKDLEKHYDMDKFTVGRGVLNPEGFKQFTDKGLSPETVQLFAAELGLDEDGAIQAYLKIAVSDRSALKRLIHRKKVPGYSEDMPRVLSAFVMSNARYSGRSLYNGEIEKSIQGIKDGNLQGEAQSVFDNMENPQEEFAGTRSMMFHHFMGFSLAFLTLNLTQPFTQTIPKLTAYVGAARAHQDMTHALGIVGKYMGKATFEFGKQAIGKPSMDWKGFEDHLPAWVKKEDYLRMSREGHLDPQNVWMIRGLERGKDGVLSGAWGNVERMAGAPAEVSESINRRGTMIAALKVAKRMGDAKLKAKGFDSAYDFAVSVIQQTQGVYNKGNRSGLARGNGKLGQFGPLVMVFKQFSINYVEQMIRHVKDREYSSVAVAMAWPFMLSGMLGLPFVDDLRDIFEGFLYRFFGIATNLPDFLQTHLGKETADILMYGYLSQKTPIDMYGRSSMGNFIPGTSFARPQEGDIKEILGASSSFFQNFVTGGELISKGQYKDGLVLMSPRYIKDAVHAVDIWNTGAYRNSRGDKIMDMSKQDAVIKGVFQFNPASNARAGRERSEAYHMNNMVKAKSNDFAVLLAAAMYQEDDDKIDKLYTEMDEWNDRNAEQYHIDIDKIEKSAEKRMEKKDFTSDERQNIGGNLEEYLEDKAGT